MGTFCKKVLKYRTSEKRSYFCFFKYSIFLLLAGPDFSPVLASCLNLGPMLRNLFFCGTRPPGAKDTFKSSSLSKSYRGVKRVI